MKLFEYVVIREEKTDKDGEVVQAAELVVPVTQILARDEQQAQMMAARAIPEDEIENNLDRLITVIRPF